MAMSEDQAKEIIKAIIYQARQNEVVGANDWLEVGADEWLNNAEKGWNILFDKLQGVEYRREAIGQALVDVGEDAIGVTPDIAKEYLDIDTNARLADDAGEEVIDNHITARQHMTKKQANLIIFALIAQAIKDGKAAESLVAVEDGNWDDLRKKLIAAEYTKQKVIDVFNAEVNGITVEKAKKYLNLDGLTDDIVGAALTGHFNNQISDAFLNDAAINNLTPTTEPNNPRRLALLTIATTDQPNQIREYINNSLKEYFPIATKGTITLEILPDQQVKQFKQKVIKKLNEFTLSSRPNLLSLEDIETLNSKIQIVEQKQALELFKVLSSVVETARSQASASAIASLEEAQRQITKLFSCDQRVNLEALPDDTASNNFKSNMITAFQELQREIIYLQNTLPKRKHVSYFGLASYKAEEVQKSTMEAFSAWEKEITAARHVPIPSESTVAQASNTRNPESNTKVSARQMSRTSEGGGADDDVYRCYPPAEKATPRDTVYYEHESGKRESGSYAKYELTVLDLPESISDRGLLKEFLKQYLKKSKVSDLRVEDNQLVRDKTPKDDTVILSKVDTLPPILSNTTLLFFLKNQIYIQGTSDSSIIKEFEKFKEENRQTMSTTKLHSNYMWSKKVAMPNEAIFQEAAKILNTLLLNGKPTMYIHEVNNKQLSQALHCLIEANDLQRRIVLPNDAPRASGDQLALAKQEGYTLQALAGGTLKREVESILAADMEQLNERDQGKITLLPDGKKQRRL